MSWDFFVTTLTLLMAAVIAAVIWICKLMSK